MHLTFRGVVWVFRRCILDYGNKLMFGNGVISVYFIVIFRVFFKASHSYNINLDILKLARYINSDVFFLMTWFISLCNYFSCKHSTPVPSIPK